MRGKVEKFLPKIKQRLSLRFNVVDFVTTQTSKSAEEIALKSAGKYDVILALGGDGTLHQVINGVLKSEYRPIVGILPFGTCNDVARSLKMPKKLDDAINCILRLNTTNYDVAFDGENYMTYSLAGGYLTTTSYQTTAKSKSRFGKLAYFFYALKNVFKFNALPLTVDADNERIHGKFNYFMLLNSEYAGGFKLNKGEDLSNKKIKLVMIKKGKFLGSFFVFLRLFFFGIKNIKKSRLAVVKDVSKIEIINHSNTSFCFDGEKYKFLKKKIKVSNSIKMIKN